jgi:WD40 repeat protein
VQRPYSLYCSCPSRASGLEPHRNTTSDPALNLQEPVERLSLATDGSLLASAGHDSRVRIWSTRWLIDGGNEDSARAEDDGADQVRRRDQPPPWFWVCPRQKWLSGGSIMTAEMSVCSRSCDMNITSFSIGSVRMAKQRCAQ